MAVTQKRLHQMVQEIDCEGDGLTEWEVEFIAGLIDDGVRSFSVKQTSVIKRLWREKIGGGDDE